MQFDTQGFFSKPESLDLEKYLIFDYLFETHEDPRAAAAHLACEQSTAQWKRVGVDEDFREKHGAKVISLEEVMRGKYRCRIAHPHINFGAKIPNILTAACGEGAFFSPGIDLIKLIDIEFPKSFLKDFEGPKFGTKGIRDLLDVHERPIFFGVVKPNLGLSPADFAELAYESWMGGLDVAKDDEMMGDVAWSPLKDRVRAVAPRMREAEKATGEKKAYLANITDEVDRLIEHHDTAVKNGAGMLMINGMTTGLSAVRMVARHTRVPLVAHFDFIDPFTRLPNFGVSSVLITKLQRIAGFDAIIMPGFGPRMKMSEEEVIANVRACSEDLGNIKPCLAIPGGSDWAGTLEPLYKKLGTYDFGFIPGRGVFAHPSGPKAGAASLRQAWSAIAEGAPVKEYAKFHKELLEAFEFFG